MSFTFRRIPAGALAAGIVALVLAGLGAGSGCSTKPPEWKKEGEGERAVQSPWPTFATQIRKGTDPASCRAALQQLNAALAQSQDPRLQPPGLTPEQEAAARTLLHLTEDEVKELRPTSFTNLDPQYLSESFYLRDIVRALDVKDLPPVRQAELAFAWVCRQIVLQPWVTPTSQGLEVMPPVPTTAILRRGSGSGLERAYVFLALTQQLGLDGCLIGPPEAFERDWNQPLDPSGKEIPTGPFWAVGVRIGADLFLFDPWRGEPFPGPQGKGVATLAQVQASFDQLKTWADDKARARGVTPEGIKAARPYLVAPLSGLAPRFRRLEEELGVEAPRLTVDPAALRNRFTTEGKFAEVKFWNPAQSAFSYTRVLAHFTPVEEGGTATNNSLLIPYVRSLIPPSLFVVPAELRPQNQEDLGAPEVIERLQLAAIDSFMASFLSNPSPRELTQRGQFAEVTPILVEKRRTFSAAQDRLRTDRNREQALREWATKAREVYAQFARARDREKTDPTGVIEVRQAVERFWREGASIFAALVDVLVADAGMAESTYLLALCKHEQAEQTRTRAERLAADPRQKAAADRIRARALEDWREAVGWWSRYEPYAAAQDQAYPGRAAHSRRLAERAGQQLAEFATR